MAKILDRVIKFSLYSLVFLLPLFFLPFSFEAFEFNKQYLLFFLVSIAFFAWLAKMALIDKEIRFKRTPLDIFVATFIFIVILSTIFSLDKTSSLSGFYGRFSDGLIGLLSLGILYFLITNNVSVNRKSTTDNRNYGLPITVDGLLKLFLVSVFFVILFSYFSIFGIWQRIGQIGLPAAMLQPIFNPASGSLEGLAIFLSIVLVLIVGHLLRATWNIAQLGYWGLLVLVFGLLVIVDYNPAWIILSASLSLFLVLVLARRIFRENVNKLLLPIFLVIISAIFLIGTANFQFSIFNFQLSQEQVLSQGISWKVAVGSATENIKSGFLGSGIGTFHYAFAKHKPLEINETWLWQIRFDRAGSYISEILATMGFLGILSYLLLVGMFLLMFWFLLQTKVPKLEIPLLMAFLALLVSQFVYYQNSTLAFAFWLVLGLGTVSWQKPLREKAVSFKDFPELSLIFSTLVIILGIVILGLYYFGARFYLADINYNKGLAILGQERIEKLEKAVSLNPGSSQYKVALSRTYLFEVFQELQKPLAQQDGAKMQTMVARSIDEAKRAVELQPKSVVNWENLGIIYREIIGIAAGAVEWSIKSFEIAIDLEPTNSVLYTELGKLYLLMEDSEKAREYFQRALEKKSDYADALIQEALLLEREDILDEAIARLENLITRDPWNIEAYFQLGRLYYNAGRVDQAIEVFQVVTLWMPQHSNALYSLGVAYAAKGQTQEAIGAFEKVLELNPGNPDVIQKLEELKK